MNWDEAKTQLVAAGLLSEEQLCLFESTLAKQISVTKAQSINILHDIMCQATHDPEYEVEGVCMFHIEESLARPSDNVWEKPAHVKWLKVYEWFAQDLQLKDEMEFAQALAETSAYLEEIHPDILTFISYAHIGIPVGLIEEENGE